MFFYEWLNTLQKYKQRWQSSLENLSQNVVDGQLERCFPSKYTLGVLIVARIYFRQSKKIVFCGY